MFTISFIKKVFIYRLKKMLFFKGFKIIVILEILHYNTVIFVIFLSQLAIETY